MDCNSGSQESIKKVGLQTVSHPLDGRPKPSDALQIHYKQSSTTPLFHDQDAVHAPVVP